VRYGFIAKHRAQWPVRVMCRVLQVSASGFYEWDGRAPSQRCVDNEKLTGLIRQSFAASDRTYGSRRVWQDVREWGHCVSVNRVARLMAAAGLVARRKRRRRPGDSAHATQHTIAPNLLQRQFEAEAPNRRWLADFTYIWTAEGWLYLAVVLDLFSRRVVGWSMKEEMTSQLVIDALLMAIWRRGSPTELLHHSDQGSQGGFNPSSQHVQNGDSNGRENGEDESIPPREVALTRAATCLASRSEMAVLAGDCPRAHQRGRCGGCWCVHGRRHAVVPTMWRYATISSRTVSAGAHRPIPFVCRA
jgi:putative transposase